MAGNSGWLEGDVSQNAQKEEERLGQQRTVVDQRHHQERHQGALRVVHEVAIAHPLLALAAHLAFLARLVALGHQRRIRAAEVIA